METNDGLEDKLNDFSNIVREEFSFLTNVHSFVRKELEKVAFEDSRDKNARIDYLDGCLCVRVEWYLIDASIGVGLIKLENGKIPAKFSFFEKKGFSPAISLSTLVEFVTNGELKDPLPTFGPKAGARKINKAWRERERLIKENMRGIVATYSNWLQEYGRDILKGDTSIFERVQKYATEKIAENYYGF